VTVFRANNTSDVIEAVEQMFIEASATDAALEGVSVTVAEVVNEDPSSCPWIGLYPTNVSYPSRSLGAGTGQRYQRTAFVIIVQYSGGDSGKECRRGLETLVQGVISTLLNDQSLKGQCDTLEDMTTIYDNYQQVEDTFMQEAIITITAVTTVSAF